MNTEVLTEELLFSLGLLHDCKIYEIKVEIDNLTFELADINANTVGLPEYPGRQPGSISMPIKLIGKNVLSELQGINLPARIFELEIESNSNSHIMTLRLWPNGVFELPVMGAEIMRGSVSQ